MRLAAQFAAVLPMVFGAGVSVHSFGNLFGFGPVDTGVFHLVRRRFIAMSAINAFNMLDGMDGRVARLTNTQSAFGEQFDSLSDMTSFGVAPALVMYEWILADLGRWGWAAAFVYCAARRCGWRASTPTSA